MLKKSIILDVFYCQSRLNAPKENSAVGLHFFLFHLANTHKFTKSVELLYTVLSKIKYNIECEISPKRQFQIW